MKMYPKAVVYLGCVPFNVRNARVHYFIFVVIECQTRMKWCTQALRTLSGTLEHILLEAARSSRKAWSDTRETALYRSTCFLSLAPHAIGCWNFCVLKRRAEREREHVLRYSAVSLVLITLSDYCVLPPVVYALRYARST